MNLTVIAAGAWGTALAIAFSAKHRVTLWTRETDVAQIMRDQRENTRFLPGHRLPDALLIGDDFKAALVDAELLVIATPLAGLRPTVGQLRDLSLQKPLIWVCKGMEAGTGKLPHQIVAEELGEQALCGALSGPSFAEEVAQGLPTAVTLAANNADFGHQTALALHRNILSCRKKESRVEF
jgi:glycerol-3-phosphate dehydrogenase (NAD(P)+)